MKILIEDLYEGVGIIGITLVHDNDAKDCKQTQTTKIRIQNEGTAYLKVTNGGERWSEWLEIELEGFESIGLLKHLQHVCEATVKAVEKSSS